MTYKVSVRDTRELEKRLRAGLEVNLPEECEHNRDVLLFLLENYGSKVVPAFSSLSSKEKGIIADAVAYLVRPDLIISPEEHFVLPIPLRDRGVIRISTGDKVSVHLRNDPGVLYPGFKLPKDIGEEYREIGKEFFRCYAATISFMPGMSRKLEPVDGNTFGSAFPLTDMTAYLLDPMDITDYRYSEGEVDRFHETLARQKREI